jgi:uncharacterized protein (DUF2267 family)
MLVRGFYYEG